MRAALLSAAVLGFTRPARAAEDLTLRRIMLSSGGVGYFEYEAKVTGDARLPLRVRLDQVDDVLKSVIAFDDRGHRGEVVLPGKDLVQEVFRDLPFSEGALASAPALVDALRGVEVRAELPGSVVSGRIVSVNAETAKLPSGETVTRHRLTLEAEGAVRQVVLEEVKDLKFADPAVQKQIEAALNALARQHDRGLRELTIHIPGAGERLVRVAYVVEAPLWKTTYRLTLPGDAQAKTAAIAGLAVVENRSGKDWKNVDLTLLSGNPVTFRQALYRAYYVYRPEVPIDMVSRVLPRVDEGATAVAERHAMAHGMWGYAGPLSAGALGPPPPAGLRPTMAAEDVEKREAESREAESREASTQVELRLGAVTIADGQSALLPVIERELKIERWSLYQPETDPRHPLSTVELENDSKTDLPPGAVAVYEEMPSRVFPLPVTYVGDARLGPLPAGEKRTVSYAVDLRVRIHKEEQTSRRVTTVKLAGGVMSLTRVELQTTTYTITGAAREARAVILEQPIRKDWKIGPVEGATHLGDTAEYHRFRADIPAGGTVTVKVTLERQELQRLVLANLSDEQIVASVSGTELSPETRAVFERIKTLRAAVAERERALDKLEAERKRIVEDQTRIAANLKVIPAGSDLAKTYLATLAEQEVRLRALGGEIAAAREAVAKARQELAAYVNG